MLINIVTRVYNEEYFISTFLDYYLSKNVSNIFLFDAGSTDTTLSIINMYKQKSREVKLVESNKSYQWSCFEEENVICSKIYSWILSYWSQDKNESIWMLPDVDEFIRFNPVEINNLSVQASLIFRSFCIDWFLDTELINENISSTDILQLIKDNKLKGKLADLWGNPYYKDFVFLLNKNNYNFFNNLRVFSGFHRFVNNSEVFFPPNTSYLIVDHMRIIPTMYYLKKHQKWKELVKHTKDDWLLCHIVDLFSIMNNYESFYNKNDKLMFFDKLNANIQEHSKINYNSSFFDSVIMKKNIMSKNGSKPSDFS